MPANVTPEFEKARDRYQQASSQKARLDALLEMQKTAPHHKGAENLRRDISRKVAELRKEVKKREAREKKKGSAPSLSVKKEGAGQIAVVGAPNTGKSRILNRLTAAGVEEAPYPFTTKAPEVGMMEYGGAKVQLVEVPAIVRGSSRGKANGLQFLSIVRNADAVLLAAGNREERGVVEGELESAKIFLNQKRPAVKVKPSNFKGIEVLHKKNLAVGEGKVKGFLRSRGFYNATVVLDERLESLEQLERAMDRTIAYKPCLEANPFGEVDWEKVKGRVFGLLGKIRVYTKKPGEKREAKEPLVLPTHSTVEEAARQLHKDFAGKFRYARIWGSGRFPGQRVQKDHELQDGDTLEVVV